MGGLKLMKPFTQSMIPFASPYTLMFSIPSRFVAIKVPHGAMNTTLLFVPYLPSNQKWKKKSGSMTIKA